MSKTRLAEIREHLRVFNSGLSDAEARWLLQRLDSLARALRHQRHGAGLLGISFHLWCWCVGGPRTENHEGLCREASAALASLDEPGGTT